MSENDHTSRRVSARINRALGLFLLFFGLVVLLGVFFTPEPVGRLVNLTCAAVLLGIGAIMAIYAGSGRD